ncbi:MAG TPA: hypothetical protein VIY28_10055 [Pseudonocardiaceae bacterium]
MRNDYPVHHPAGRALQSRRASPDDFVTNPSAPAPRGVLDAKRIIEIFAVVIAPVTVLTALLSYVGWIRSRAFFSYFGVEQGLLNLSVQDYALRSSDVTFGAVARLLAALVVLALVDRLLTRVQPDPSPGDRPQQTGTARGGPLAQALAVTGLALSLAGLLLALGLGRGWGLPALLGPAVLGVGSIVTFRFRRALMASLAGSRLRQQISVAALTATLALALFWAATLYAQDLGQRAAVAVDAGQTALPTVTVFSTTFLDLPGSRVRATAVPGPGATASYRYTGLSLLSYANGRWLLISGKYSANYRSSVVVLRDSEAIRVEVAAPA